MPFQDSRMFATRSSRILCNSESTMTFLYPNMTQPMEDKIERTPLLILDYVQFLAARTIQCHWRSYLSRLREIRRWKAAITIQRWWRGFNTRRKFVYLLEDMLQERLVNMYNKSATKIQALWRGWWIRRTVHDVYALQNMQACAAADLLQCIAFKLHHLLRTYSIPGVYSLRNSHCLSRVEKLLLGINYRFHNGKVAFAMSQRQDDLMSHRQNFANTKYATQVPFTGPDYKGTCKPHCEDYMRRSKDMDMRMYAIIARYDKSMDAGNAKKHRISMEEKRRRRYVNKILEKQESRKCSFCSEVIKSMSRWSIWQNKKLNISKDIFRTPENLENFLTEASTIVGTMGGRCHCNIDNYETVQCH